jgi:hypothetical protein
MQVHSSAGHAVLSDLKGLAYDAKPWFDRPDATRATRYLTEAALLSVPALWIAALVRSATARTWRPFVVSVAAVLLGLIALPVLTWAAELSVLLFRVARWLFREVARFIEWISPVVGVIVVAVVGLLAVAALVWAIGAIHRARRWPAAAVVVALLAGIGAAVHHGLLDGLFALLGRAAAAVSAWISHYVAPIIGWLVSALFVVTVVLIALGAVVALFGHVGRTIVLPFGAAGGAGREQAKCLDSAAGLGVALSMPLAGAVMDAGYHDRFTAVWRTTPLIEGLPSPVPLYDFLLREPAVHVLAPAFGDFNPAVDLALGVLVTVIAFVSLFFGRGTWSTGPERAGVLNPIMAAVGAAIALAIPVLLLTLWAKTHDDS